MSATISRILIPLTFIALFTTLSVSSQEQELPPFEKIYVSPYQILTTPYGSYYRAPNGQLEPVRSICNDNGGTYVIKITRQCPTCGRYHTGKEPSKEGGFDCSLDTPNPHYR